MGLATLRLILENWWGFLFVCKLLLNNNILQNIVEFQIFLNFVWNEISPPCVVSSKPSWTGRSQRAPQLKRI